MLLKFETAKFCAINKIINLLRYNKWTRLHNAIIANNK